MLPPSLKLLLLCACSASLLLGCAQPPSTPAPAAAKHATRAELLAWLQKQTSPVSFVSSGGHMYGTDYDTEIILGPGEQARMICDRDAIDRYEGTFSVDTAGSIRLILRHYRSDEPVNYFFRQTSRGNYLFPIGENPALEPSEKRQARMPLPAPPHWLYRQTKPKT